MRKNGREKDQLREITLIPDYIKNVPGSVLVQQGDTRVVCTALYETRVPFFLKNSGKGWVQAEYAMLPGSTGNDRVVRERQRTNNRHIEIQRFIGRSLRTTFPMKRIDGITITVDTDVLEADGGTRCASINGGMIAMVKCLKRLVYENIIPSLPQIQFIAAVSIGVLKNEILVDLDYKEDFDADADINVVSSEKGDIVEVMAFAEESTIPRAIFQQVVEIGVQKNLEIIDKLKKCV
ncbi:MAG: ribonuclease PH [Candidatus Omnitrophota bacterium]